MKRKRESLLGHVVYDFKDIEVFRGTPFQISDFKCTAALVSEGLEVTFDVSFESRAAAYKAAVDAKIASQGASRQQALRVERQLQDLIKQSHTSNEAAQEHLPTINQLILEQGAHERAAKDTAIEYDVEKVWLQAVLPSFTLVSVSGVDIDMMWVPNEPPNVVATKRIVEVVCERRTFEGIQWEGRLQKRFVMDHTRGSWPVSIAVFDGLVYVSKRNRIFILTDWPDLTLSDMRVFNDEVAITCISVDATNIYLVDHETNRVFAPPRGGGLSSTLLIQDASLKSIRGIAVSNAVVFIVAGTNEVSLYNKNTGCWLHKFVVASAINTRKLSSVAVFKNEVFVLDVEFNEILVLAFLTGRVLRILDIESDQHMLIGHIAVDQSSIFVPVGETVQQLNKQTGKLVKSYEANPDVSFHGVACGQRRVYACDQLNAVSSIS